MRVSISLAIVVVVVAMVAGAVFAQTRADVHRRAQVIAQQIQTTAQQVAAFKWEVQVHEQGRHPHLAIDSPLVRGGLAILTRLGTEIRDLRRLQPGAAIQTLQADESSVYTSGIGDLSLGRTPAAAATGGSDPGGIQLAIDRLDADAERVATNQSSVAATTYRDSIIGTIGSLVLGLLALTGLGLSHARLRRKSILAEQVREIERRSEERTRALVSGSTDVVCVIGPELDVRWIAASVQRLLGHEATDLIDGPLTAILHPEDVAPFQRFVQASIDGQATTIRSRFALAAGGWCHVETIAENRLDDPAISGLVLSMRDITERKAFEDELRRLAFHDPLTGLANRAHFEERLTETLAQRAGTSRPMAVLFLDIDDFKTINDSLGHSTGDGLLCEVAARVSRIVRPDDTVARLGGDEFAVLAEEVAGAASARELAERIRRSLADSFVIDGRRLTISGSIGFALSESETTPEALLRNADVAMYAAKSHGKNVVRGFEPTMHGRALERLELRSELERAIRDGELVLEYQPVVSMPTGEVAGLEALVRWDDPHRGRLPPAHFIPFAEETGLIVPLGAWVLERACSDAAEFAAECGDRTPPFISVNVSVRQLAEDSFTALVADILQRTGLPATALVLEITEGLLADDASGGLDRLTALRAMGVKIAIDDFGTGYSALSYLRRDPIDILKLDRSFIEDLDGSDRTASVVESIVHLGENLGLEVVAEGIEHLHQAHALARIGSVQAQGFLFSHPVAPEEIRALLRSGATIDPRGVFSE